MYQQKTRVQKAIPSHNQRGAIQQTELVNKMRLIFQSYLSFEPVNILNGIWFCDTP